MLFFPRFLGVVRILSPPLDVSHAEDCTYLPAGGRQCGLFSETQNGTYRFGNQKRGVAVPKLTKSVPKYRRHRASGQAVVSLYGIDYYLGPYRSKASRLEYDRLITEWAQNGRSAPSRRSDTTIVEVASAYLKHARSYYVKNGKPTREAEMIRELVHRVDTPYGRTAAVDFGPLALKTVRQKMVDDGLSRRYINKSIDRLRRMFKWAAAEELIPASVPQALAMVTGLRRGRTEARESEPVRPVSDADVEATLPYLAVIPADMVRFQRLTGCRPGEVCALRPCDVDRSDDIWAYRPESHKTEHHGRERVIHIGPRAQQVLRPYLLRAAAAVANLETTEGVLMSPCEHESAATELPEDTMTDPSGDNDGNDGCPISVDLKQNMVTVNQEEYQLAPHHAQMLGPLGVARALRAAFL